MPHLLFRRGVGPGYLCPSRVLRGMLAVVAALSAAACGGLAARVPPLPPPPHPVLQGPAVAEIRRAGVLRVAIDLSYPPMAFRDDGGTPRGFEVDLAALLAGAFGVRLEIRDMPAAAMRAGFPVDADMLVGMRPGDRVPGPTSEPYYVSGQAILWREGAPVRTPEGLRGLRVAVAAGSPGERLAGAAGDLMVTYLPEQAFRAVSERRAQAAVGDRPLVLGFGQAHRDLRVTTGPWEEAPFVVAVRRAAPDLAAFASAALRELREDGGLARLRERWHL